MPARRCNTHGNWPNDVKKFLNCPECGEKTDFVNNAEPMSHSEMCHRLFEVHCAKRELEERHRVQDMRGFEAALEATPSIPDPGEVPADEQPDGE